MRSPETVLFCSMLHLRCRNETLLSRTDVCEQARTIFFLRDARVFTGLLKLVPCVRNRKRQASIKISILRNEGLPPKRKKEVALKQTVP